MGVLLGAFCGTVFHRFGAMVFCFSFPLLFLFFLLLGAQGF